MKLKRGTEMSELHIWEPRYRDMVVLIPTFKVRQHNHIRFTKTKNYPGNFYVSGEKARTNPVAHIGKIAMYEVPMSQLEELIIEEE